MVMVMVVVTIFWWSLCQGAAGEQYLDQLFRIFDKDGDGSIDFKVQERLLVHVTQLMIFYFSKIHDPGVYDCHGYE